MNKTFAPISYKDVTLNGGFWGERQTLNAETTIDAVYDQFEKTGRFSALTHAWREGEPDKPHIFYDSDAAKWMEGAAYSLHTRPRPELEDKIDALVNLIEDGMSQDGYFNSYYQTVEPAKRFTNRDNHELYCAGHLIEAAVAYYEATGKHKFLDLMRRYADHIREVFVQEKSASFKTPGHEEIELALVRLWQATNNREYLELAKFFIDTRGSNDDAPNGSWVNNTWFDIRYAQDQAPVAEQMTAEGHVVRFGYLFTAAADIAREYGDERLKTAVRRVWDDIVTKKLYITGGIGNLAHGEAFGPAYFLPNFQAYTETCASIAMAFIANRMLRMEPDREYSDMLERQLYNGALAGISLDGKAFFYENPLEQKPADLRFMNAVKANGRPTQRLEVFGCSCCPPNILRLIANIGGYFYNTDGETIFVHLYNSGKTTIKLSNGELRLTQTTKYPDDGHVKIKIGVKTPTQATIALRMPGWCANSSAKVGEAAPDRIDKGYAYFTRIWNDGDVIQLNFPMAVRLLEARPEVAADCGRVAIMRGPLVYALEEIDNGDCLADIRLAEQPRFKTEFEPELLDGVTSVTFDATRRDHAHFGEALYGERNSAPRRKTIRAKAVPYYAWGNRSEGELETWILD